MPQVARFWNSIAYDFDAIYTGQKSPLARLADRILRKDMYQRFDWVMDKSGDVRNAKICDIGCGSGRFVAEFAHHGAAHITGIDVAPQMLELARGLVNRQGVSSVCDFVHTDVLYWRTKEVYDITVAIGFWDYIADVPSRLKVIRSITGSKFLSAWPRFWTWRMPIRKLRLGLKGCPVYFFRRPQVEKLMRDAGFEIVSFETVGKLFCVEARPASRRGALPKAA